MSKLPSPAVINDQTVVADEDLSPGALTVNEGLADLASGDGKFVNAAGDRKGRQLVAGTLALDAATLTALETVTANQGTPNAGGAQSWPITIEDGKDITIGAIADAAVTGDNAGTISSKLRGVNKILEDVWDDSDDRLRVSSNQQLSLINETVSVLPFEDFDITHTGAVGTAVNDYTITNFNGGTADYDGLGSLVVATGTNVNGGAKARSKTPVQYAPGRTDFTRISFMLPPKTDAALESYFALINESDGGNQIAVGRKNNKTFIRLVNAADASLNQELFFEDGQWNGDKFDGSANSEYQRLTDIGGGVFVDQPVAIDFTKRQVGRIEFVWHGSLGIKIQFESPNMFGFVTAHTFQFINTSVAPWASDPNFFVEHYAKKTAGSATDYQYKSSSVIAGKMLPERRRVTSVVNSYTGSLAAGATTPSANERMGQWEAVRVRIYSDQSGTLTVAWPGASSDPSPQVITVTAGVVRTYFMPAKTDTVNVSFKNTSGSTAAVELTTTLLPKATNPISSLQDPLTDESLGVQNKSVLYGLAQLSAPVIGSSAVSGAASTSEVISVPAGTQDGDYLVATVYVSGLVAFTPPAGWTQQGAIITQGANARMGMWVRRASGEPASYTWNWDLSRQHVLNMVAVRNVSLNAPIVDQQIGQAGSGTALNIASTAYSDGGTVIGFWCVDGPSTNTPPLNWTQLQQVTTNRGSVSASRSFGTTGTTGTITATASSGGANINMSISLRPTNTYARLKSQGGLLRTIVEGRQYVLGNDTTFSVTSASKQVYAAETSAEAALVVLNVPRRIGGVIQLFGVHVHFGAGDALVGEFYVEPGTVIAWLTNQRVAVIRESAATADVTAFFQKGLPA